MTRPLHVPFLTIEDDDDLLVSFALGEHAQTSLTLLRTPKYERLLDEHERGVTVGMGEVESGAPALLVALKWADDLLEIESTARRYVLDVAAVDAAEVKAAKAILRKMNFDRRFKFEDV